MHQYPPYQSQQISKETDPLLQSGTMR
jgi:hypothetical protein